MNSPPDGPEPDKQALRSRARRLAPATPTESAAVVGHLAAASWLAGARRACLYLAMPGEVDLAALPAHLGRVDWVTTRTGDDPLLTVHPLGSARERHRFGFDQPVAAAPRVAAATVDVWLVPGLAFAPTGDRLGNGAGYYDRLLATARPTARFVGVTLDRRVVDVLPRESHDVLMDHLVTESALAAVRPA